ncbi:BhlA/UviB family holin-like peptide [Clostridium akagii]|uniref:BhlA/UviB family holin-like peptide n=1 Tax=Clostridium akagii TaxID=91623 RepID=UPI00047B7B46|nr:BhlA/UviB family holin-like peptide [Clostridium akagii]
MDTNLLKLAASQGVWATLAVILIFYILKNQEKRDLKQEVREKNYQKIILKLTKQFEVIEDIERNISEIKETIDNHNFK